MLILGTIYKGNLGEMLEFEGGVVLKGFLWHFRSKPNAKERIERSEIFFERTLVLKPGATFEERPLFKIFFEKTIT